MILSIAYFLFALLLLVSGGYFLTQGIKFLSRIAGFPIILMSFLIIGVGTSAPELFVTLLSHIKGESDLAIANVIGSNIFNILIVVGISFFGIVIIQDKRQIINSTKLLLFTTLLIIPLVLDQQISRLDGWLFLMLFVLFLTPSHLLSTQKIKISSSASTWWSLVCIIIGFILLFFGSNQTIQSVQVLGDLLNIDSRFQGLFLLSVGTSLPELAVGLVSLVKKESEITFGGIIGSNVFNTLLIPGFAAVLLPLPVSRVLVTIDGVFMLVSTIILFLILFLCRKVPRYFSFILVSIYFLYFFFVLSVRIS